MCFTYIIKRNFVGKKWKWSVVFILLLTMYWPVSCWFWLYCCCKTFWNNWITFSEVIWSCNAVESCLELRSLYVYLKIIAHLWTFISQSDSSIQWPHSISLYIVHSYRYTHEGKSKKHIFRASACFKTNQLTERIKKMYTTGPLYRCGNRSISRIIDSRQLNY